jgi:cold-inducible RNA-binding protein
LNPPIGPIQDELQSSQRTQQIKTRMNTKLFVGNLSFNTTENALQDAFAQFGTVTDVNLVTDRMSGRPRGFAFVTMATPEEAQAAIEGLNGAQIDGRDLTVNEARPREDRPARGGGYGGGGGGGGGREGGREGGRGQRRSYSR